MKYEQQIEKSLHKNIQQLKALQKETQNAQHRVAASAQNPGDGVSTSSIKHPESPRDASRRSIETQNKPNNQSSIINNQLKGKPNPQPQATSDESRATNQKVSPPIHSAGPHANMDPPQSQGEPITKNKPNSEKRATSDEPRDTLHASRDAIIQNKPNFPLEDTKT
jgi:hypothetical protein